MIERLSIITPVYNGERFIESCITNVIEQQDADVEHIIVDGGSTDGTLEVIMSYARRYKHIRWLSQKDKGQSDAMNKGIQMSQGSVLGILNVDDYYARGTIRDVLDIFKNLPEPSLLVGNCNIWGNKGKNPGINKPAHLDISQLLTADEKRFPFPVNPSAYFYHKSLHNIIGMYDINDHHTMDLDFILKAVMHIKPVYVNQVFGNFRYFEGTKTFEDAKTGAGKERLKILVNKYKVKLPLWKRLKILYYLTVGKLFYFARS